MFTHTIPGCGGVAEAVVVAALLVEAEVLALAELLEEAAGALLAELPVTAALVLLAPFFVAAVVAEAAFPVSEAAVLPAVVAPLAVAFAAFFVFFVAFVVVLVLVLEVVCACSVHGSMAPATRVAKITGRTRRRGSNFMGYLLANRSIRRGTIQPSITQPECAAAK